MKKYILPVLWMLMIFVLSSIPGNAFPSDFARSFSWLVHLAEYGILAGLWYIAMPQRSFLVFFICFAYAIIDETHQLFVVYRHFSVIDILVDMAGIFIGILTGKRIWNLLLKKLQ